MIDIDQPLRDNEKGLIVITERRRDNEKALIDIDQTLQDNEKGLIVITERRRDNEKTLIVIDQTLRDNERGLVVITERRRDNEKTLIVIDQTLRDNEKGLIDIAALLVIRLGRSLALPEFGLRIDGAFVLPTCPRLHRGALFPTMSPLLPTLSVPARNRLSASLRFF